MPGICEALNKLILDSFGPYDVLCMWVCIIVFETRWVATTGMVYTEPGPGWNLGPLGHAAQGLAFIMKGLWM